MNTLRRARRKRANHFGAADAVLCAARAKGREHCTRERGTEKGASRQLALSLVCVYIYIYIYNVRRVREGRREYITLAAAERNLS